MDLPKKLTIEDMIIEAELSALADGKDHDRVMDNLVEIGKIADERYTQLARNRDNLNIRYYELLDDYLETSVELDERTVVSAILGAISLALVVAICYIY